MIQDENFSELAAGREMDVPPARRLAAMDGPEITLGSGAVEGRTSPPVLRARMGCGAARGGEHGQFGGCSHHAPRTEELEELPAVPLPDIDLFGLTLLGARRAAVIEAWHQRFRTSVGLSARLTAAEFKALFGRELERLLEPDAARAVEPVRAALRTTAACLAGCGVPLAEVLTATMMGTQAAHAVVGDDATPAFNEALVALERARIAVYSQVYLHRERPAAGGCSKPVMGMAMEESAPAVPVQSYGIVGASPAIRRVHTMIEAAARGAQNVLITGESGTGKELVARAIHQAAGGERRNFVAINCAALPRELVESELFGHTRGAFTGAGGAYPGLFRAAEGGTLFLDELTEMATDIQAKLLRVLEEREVRPVGSLTGVPVRVRIIASTNRDPQQAILEGKLRHDLYFRLQGLTIHVPPLRERRSDIPAMVDHFLFNFCSRRSGCISGVSPEAMDVLTAADWPGNVRELRSAVEYAVTTGTTGLIRTRDLPPQLQNEIDPVDRQREESRQELPTLAEAEAQLIRLAISRCQGNKVQAARALGISRHKLYDMLKKIGVD